MIIAYRVIHVPPSDGRNPTVSGGNIVHGARDYADTQK